MSYRRVIFKNKPVYVKTYDIVNGDEFSVTGAIYVDKEYPERELLENGITLYRCEDQRYTGAELDAAELNQLSDRIAQSFLTALESNCRYTLNGHGVTDIDIEYSNYSEDCFIKSAWYARTGIELNDDELEQLTAELGDYIHNRWYEWKINRYDD